MLARFGDRGARADRTCAWLGRRPANQECSAHIADDVSLMSAFADAFSKRSSIISASATLSWALKDFARPTSDRLGYRSVDTGPA